MADRGKNRTPGPGDDAFAVGLDVGGTFVDCAVLSGGRLAAIGKAPTTPADPAIGVLAAVAAAAAELGLTERMLLARAATIVHGTTVGLNTLLTGSGARVGLLATRGHEDALLIGRVHQKVAGLGTDELIRVAELAKPAPLVPRWRVHGIDERIDASGDVVAPLDEAGVARAARLLGDAGCEAVAIGFLWSFRNPVHERRAAAIVREVLPAAPVSISSEVAPVLGEYERIAATVVNAYLAHAQPRYLERLAAALAERGFDGELDVLLSSGGALPARVAADHPVETLRSGPVGGTVAVARLADELGRRDLVATDVGGTSFDVALVIDGRPELADVTLAGQLHLAVPGVDVASIGAGGGSVAWADPDGGLHVGPRSAGADPGPACYGRGGVEPTVTDADLVLGRLPDAVLGGRLVLDRRAAERAVAALGDGLGLDPIATAAGIAGIADARMADLIRQVTLERGHDPRSLVLVAYGGAGGLHAGGYGFDAGATEVVVPRGASVFSAIGLARADRRRTYQRSGPLVAPLDAAAVRRAFADMERQARADAGRAALELVREIDFRYRRQTHRLAVGLEPGRLGPRALAEAVDRFERDYERVYGPGTGYRVAGIEATAFRLTAIVRAAPGPGAPPVANTPGGRRSARPTAVRRVHVDGWIERTPVFDGEALRAGHVVDGPGVIDFPATTILVRPGQQATIDPNGHAHLARSA
jgi:N-methylhydantoinase A